MSVSFKSGAVTVTLTAHNYPFRKRKVSGNVTIKTGGGTRKTQKKGAGAEYWTLEFITLSDQDRTDLDSFFYNTVEGTANSWTFVDTDSTEYTAWFTSDDLEFTEESPGRWSINITIEIQLS